MTSLSPNGAVNASNRSEPKSPYYRGLSAEPSDGLEPSTPSLPWRERRRTAAVRGRQPACCAVSVAVQPLDAHVQHGNLTKNLASRSRNTWDHGIACRRESRAPSSARGQARRHHCTRRQPGERLLEVTTVVSGSRCRPPWIQVTCSGFVPRRMAVKACVKPPQLWAVPSGEGGRERTRRTLTPCRTALGRRPQ